MAGVVDPFLEAANRVTLVKVVAHGRTLAHIGLLAIFPMSSVARRRIVATIPNAEWDAPSFELVKRILSERAPSGHQGRVVFVDSRIQQG
jgi:hypothetical protein